MGKGLAERTTGDASDVLEVPTYNANDESSVSTEPPSPRKDSGTSSLSSTPLKEVEFESQKEEGLMVQATTAVGFSEKCPSPGPGGVTPDGPEGGIPHCFTVDLQGSPLGTALASPHDSHSDAGGKGSLIATQERSKTTSRETLAVTILAARVVQPSLYPDQNQAMWRGVAKPASDDASEVLEVPTYKTDDASSFNSEPASVRHSSGTTSLSSPPPKLRRT
jgi:hypothetical protein